MDFKVSDGLAIHREAARKWVDENVDLAWLDEQHRTGIYQNMDLHRALAKDGLLGAGWKPELGGSDVDPDFARTVMDEVTRLGFHIDGWVTTAMIINTINHVGTEEQKQRYIRPALRGEVMIALGYSEPDSGSDMAAAKTAATRDGDEWIIDGQKMFTSTAEVCSHVIVLARSNPDVPKRKGLTMFLVPTSSPGFEIQPIHTLGNQRTNTTYYTNIRVPDSARLGAVDEGWGVIRTALVYERGVGMPYTPLTGGVELAAWAKSARRDDGTRPFDDPQVADRIGRMAIEAEVARLLAMRIGWMADRGEMPGVEGSMAKLYKSEADQRHHRDALDVLGADGLLAPGAADAPLGGRLEFGFRASVVETIYGGASEIMREMIAEGRLGLPRNRQK